MMFWQQKVLSEDFADLSIGRVYFKPITNGLLNKVTSASTIIGSSINNNLFFQLMEYQLVDLKNKQIDNLNIADGNKLRTKLRAILDRHGILEASSATDKDVFCEQDKRWFEQSREKVLDTYNQRKENALKR